MATTQIQVTACDNELILIAIPTSPNAGSAREALGNKAVKRSLHSDLFQMDVLGAD
jgi:hypothetical protein